MLKKNKYRCLYQLSFCKLLYIQPISIQGFPFFCPIIYKSKQLIGQGFWDALYALLLAEFEAGGEQAAPGVRD